MKKNYLLLLLLFVTQLALSQVTQMYTDFNTFWSSSSTSINATKPNLSHNLLAFRWNGTLYSTGVDNAKLTANGVTYQNTKFRALPITAVPLTGGSSYFIGFGALQDGITNGISNTFINPIVTTVNQKASYLTDGPQGLNIGTCLTNIPTTGNLTFNLSVNGITLANINDGVPDILVSQIATPDGTFDELWFETAAGVQVGTKVSINLSNATLFPTVGNWTADFYNNDSTQNSGGFVQTDRPFKFFAVDLTTFGITAANYANARRLIYKPGGTSDPAFLAFNEPSIGVAMQLLITAQPTTSDCSGNMPSSFTVRLADSFGAAVEQAGYVITASMETGPGQLLGTVTATTNAQGIATFSTLNFEVGGDHTIRFENTSLQPAISANITGPECDANVWTGNVNTNWDNTGNWQTASIPNANNNVTIPAGRPNYPVLNVNAGAKDLAMGAGATINLNGRLFTIKGNITKDATAYINAATSGSVLYMSGSSAQTIPSGFIQNNDIANFTVENAAGVTTNNPMNISNILRVRSGNFMTNDIVALVCSFSPRRTGQIATLTGNIVGNITTEQCFPARRAYRFVSPSVTTTTSIRYNWQENPTAWNNNPKPGYGTHITGVGASGSNPALTDGVNGFDWQPSGTTSMFTFNNTSQQWVSVTSTTGTLTAGTPYRLMIRGSRDVNIQSNSSAPSNTKLRSTGTVVKGPISVTGLSSISGNYNFVGNPFQSVVDMNTVMGSSYNLTNFYYIWDPTLGGTPIVGQTGGRGAYVTINASTGAKSNASSAATRYLQPYQAFFVQTGTQGGVPQLTFTEGSKANSQSQTSVFRVAGHPYINLTLFNEEAFLGESTAADGLRIDFIYDENNDFDANDAIKFTNSDENISRVIGDNYLSMENRAYAEAGEELPLSVNQYRKQTYTMQLEIGHFEELEVYLKDYYLNQQTLLADDATTNVNFSVDNTIPASIAASRFSIVFQAPELGVGDNSLNNMFSVFPNPVSGNELYINAAASYNSADIAVYNTLGQKVYGKTSGFGSNNQVAIPVSTLNTGIYILKVKTDSGETYTTRFIKE